MFAFVIFVVFLVVSVFSFWLSKNTTNKSEKRLPQFTGMASALIATVALIASVFVQVSPSHTGVVTTFGKINSTTLTEGAHFVLPWSKVTEVFLGQQKAEAQKSDAGSKDLQQVHADIVINYTIDPTKARQVYVINPSLNYNELIVQPAIYEIFKSAVAKYTAEELVTKRQEVSTEINRTLGIRLKPYHILIQNVNIINFGFSKSFNAAIEEKVTASQKAETARRNLERVKFEVEARIAQAEGEAKAIQIQAIAINSQGGDNYVNLKAVEKWNGILPRYVTSGAAMPFVSIK